MSASAERVTEYIKETCHSLNICIAKAWGNHLLVNRCLNLSKHSLEIKDSLTVKSCSTVISVDALW